MLKICKKYKDDIIDNLLKHSSVLYAHYLKDNDRIKIVFLPKRFDIIIKDGFAYFYLKGDE